MQFQKSVHAPCQQHHVLRGAPVSALAHVSSQRHVAAAAVRGQCGQAQQRVHSCAVFNLREAYDVRIPARNLVGDAAPVLRGRCMAIRKSENRNTVRKVKHSSPFAAQ